MTNIVYFDKYGNVTEKESEAVKMIVNTGTEEIILYRDDGTNNLINTDDITDEEVEAFYNNDDPFIIGGNSTKQ